MWNSFGVIAQLDFEDEIELGAAAIGRRRGAAQGLIRIKATPE
jgi:hypothetical protein